MVIDINKHISNTLISLVKKYGYEWCDEKRIKEILISLYNDQPEIKAILIVKNHIIDPFQDNALKNHELLSVLKEVIVSDRELTEELQWALLTWLKALDAQVPLDLEIVLEESVTIKKKEEKNKTVSENPNTTQNLVMKHTIHSPLTNEENQQLTPHNEERIIKGRKKADYKRLLVVTLFIILLFYGIDRIPKSETRGIETHQYEETSITEEEETQIINDKDHRLIEDYKNLAADGKIKSCEFSLGDNIPEYLLQTRTKKVGEALLVNNDYDLCTYYISEEGTKQEVTKVVKSQIPTEIDFFQVREEFGDPAFYYLDGYFIILEYRFHGFKVEKVFNNLDNNLAKITIEANVQLNNTQTSDNHHRNFNLEYY